MPICNYWSIMLQDAAISRCVKMLGLDRCLQNVRSTVAVLRAGTGCGLFEIELWTGHVYGRLGLVHSPSDFKYDVQDRLIILKWVNWYIQDRREILQRLWWFVISLWSTLESILPSIDDEGSKISHVARIQSARDRLAATRLRTLCSGSPVLHRRTSRREVTH